MRIKYLGEDWEFAKVRGTPNNTGDGLNMALEIGALEHGYYQSCHATPMDLHMKNFGNLDLDPKERKSYRDRPIGFFQCLVSYTVCVLISLSLSLSLCLSLYIKICM